MQISSMSLSASPRLGILQAQSDLARAQAELSSGQLADIGLGLGGSTGTFVSLDAQSSRLQAYKSGNTLASTGLTAATSALDTLRTTASAFLSSLTSAGTTGTIQGALGSTASSNLDALTSTLNTTVEGRAIFAGINTAVAPLSTYAAGSPAKAAVDQAFMSAFGTTQDSPSAASISGSAMQGFLSGSYASLFGAANYGTTWSSASDTTTATEITSGETVSTSVSANAQPFRELAQAYTMVKEFGGSNFGSAAGQAVIASASQLVASAVTGLTGLETGIGATQTAISDADTRLTSQIGYLSTSRGDMVGVDAATLSTTISGLQTKIQASYEVTAQLQQLSLVNYLK